MPDSTDGITAALVVSECILREKGELIKSNGNPKLPMKFSKLVMELVKVRSSYTATVKSASTHSLESGKLRI